VSQDYLSVPRFLEQAQQLGLDVSERTINYYIARGLLPKPIKRPFNGADGRVAYLPAEGLKQLKKILIYKEQGLKLEHIRRVLEGKGQAQAAVDESQRQAWQREVVYRFLRHLPSGQSAAARLKLLSTLGSDPSQVGLDDLKDYFVETLTSLVGPEHSRRWVNEYFLHLGGNELHRQTRRLTAELQGAGRPGGGPDPLRQLRKSASDFSLKRIDEADWRAYLEGWESSLNQAAKRWIQEDEGEIRDFLIEGTSLALQALQALKTADRGNIRSLLGELQQGLEMLAAAQHMLQGRVRALTWQQASQTDSSGGR